MIPESVLSQIQDRTDIVELISAYVPLKRAGRSFKGLCPFHGEKTPSFMVNPDKQIFHCFGCGAGGNVFGFLMKYAKKDFREAVETLAGRAGIEIPDDRADRDPQRTERLNAIAKANQLAADFYHDFLLNRREAAGARNYLKERGILDSTAEEFNLGYAPNEWEALVSALKGRVTGEALEKAGLASQRKDGTGHVDRFRNRIIFPITDQKGTAVAFGARVMDTALPKYLNSPESELYVKGRHLYGLAQAKPSIRERDEAVIVEGYIDVIACHQAGVKHAVASLGTALTTDQARLIRRNTRNVIMLYDADAAGELATLRGLEIFLEEGMDVKIVRLAKGHDPDSFVREHGPEKFQAQLKNAQSLFDYKLALLKTKFDTRSLDGKVQAANAMVPLLAKVQNEILKAAWTQDLAKQLGLSGTAVEAEMKKSGARALARPAAAPGAERQREDVEMAEKLLIGLLLEDRVLAARASKELKTGDFPSARAGQIAARALKDPDETAAAILGAYASDPEASRLLSAACAEADAVVDRKRTYEDCLLWLKRLKMRTAQEDLKTQIAEAENRGDKNRISELLKDFNELNRGMIRIHEKEK